MTKSSKDQNGNTLLLIRTFYVSAAAIINAQPTEWVRPRGWQVASIQLTENSEGENFYAIHCIKNGG